MLRRLRRLRRGHPQKSADGSPTNGVLRFRRGVPVERDSVWLLSAHHLSAWVSGIRTERLNRIAGAGRVEDRALSCGRINVRGGYGCTAGRAGTLADGSQDSGPVAARSLPVQNQATGLSEMVTRTTPGVAADGNGFAHPLGEHADTSISIDNQPITDQQAKIFSNQISTSIVQTMEVITGAPPAEFGDKTSLIINVTTQSGLGKNKPFGSLSSQYGSFGTWSEGLTYGVGSAHWGNFAALNTSGTGRFLDTPEFLPLHDHGNAEAVFDRARLAAE